MDGHACGTCVRHEGGESRDLCSFCAAIAVDPSKQSGTMKAVIAGEQLQIEIKKLHRTMIHWIGGQETLLIKKEDEETMVKVGIPSCSKNGLGRKIIPPHTQQSIPLNWASTDHDLGMR